MGSNGIIEVIIKKRVSAPDNGEPDRDSQSRALRHSPEGILTSIWEKV